MSLSGLFTPRVVAVVGSASEGKIGRVLLGQLVEGGFPDVVAVNPKAVGAFGVQAFDAISRVGRPIDLAVIASPAATVVRVLEDCGQTGVKAAVVITAGFSEIGNEAGEREIAEAAARHGIRLVGPNCAGIVNTHHDLYPTLETRPPSGTVAFVSQSGALGGAVLSWAEEQGIGFSKFVSYGNGADLGAAELLDFLRDDEETEVAALYLETLPDGRRFMAAARRFTAVKPLIVIKSGRSSAGQRAAQSHTGSLAGADAVYDAALRQAGALRVDTVEAMFDLCRGFTGLPPVRGTRLAIVTNSGGPAVLAADRAEAVGLHVDEPSPALRDRLAVSLSSNTSLGNPFDFTVEGGEAAYRETLSAVLEEYDAALAVDVCTPYLDSAAHARGIVAAARADKPVAANLMAGKTVSAGLPVLKASGIPNFVTGERAVEVLARMAAHEAQRAAARDLPGIPGDEPTPFPGTGPVLEPEGMAWLREHGIPVPAHRVAESAEAAVAAARELGYPVVVKVVSPGILHKTEHGGVITGIRDDEAAAAAFGAVEAAAFGYGFQGALVVPEIVGGIEVLIGILTDPQFGPVIACGLGGIHVEVLRGVTFRVAPLDRIEAEAMIREIKGFPLLEGARGRAPRDLDALAETLVTVSELPFRTEGIREIDLNPVFLLTDGLLVGDVRVIRRDGAEGPEEGER